MPVIEVSLKDLEKLIGKPLNIDDIEKYLPMLKCEIEEIIDETIAYEATHDRPDLFSAEGLARALKGLLEIEIGLRKFNIAGKSEVGYCRGPEYRPYVLLAIVKNLNLNDEAVKQIMNLQEKLHITYCRNRRKVSIGVYDLDTIKLPVYYEEIRPDEIKFVPLNEVVEMTPREILKRTEKGRTYAHLIEKYPVYPILRDAEGKVLSLPPIINSDDTKVTEKTKNVLIDVTGTDLRLMMDVLKIITTSIAERGQPEVIVPFRIVMNNKTVLSPDLSVNSMKLHVEYVKELSGIEITSNELIHYLLKMRHDARVINEKEIGVKIAPYRVDVLHEVDLIEDILMAYDYERIDPEFLPPSHSGKISPIELLTRKIREIMIGLGFQEVASYMMSNPDTLLNKMRLENISLIEVENPKMEKYTCLRNWLLPGLLEVINFNRHLGLPIKVFEIGDVVIYDETLENKAKSERHMACAIASEDVTMTDIMVICKALLMAFGLRYSLIKASHPSFIEGRCAKIIVNREEIGLLGEIHPEVLINFGIDVPIAALEISVDLLKSLIS